MTVGAEIISMLLTVNGVLLVILMKQISTLNVNLDKLRGALSSKVETKVCDDYREMCFKTCPERGRHEGGWAK